MPKQLTKEQQDIVATSQAMRVSESLKIQACAGSGKTSTLVEISKANSNSSFLYLAFNKAIVEEAKNKFPDNVAVKTTHALAYASIIAPKKYTVVPKHTFFELKDLLEIEDYEEFSEFSRGLNFFLNSSISTYTDPLIQKLFEAAQNGKIPYTHSMYLKEYQMLSREKKNLNKYDFILLDEAQDTNGVTLAIFMDNDCKKIVVGDTFQNIYGFRDTVNALEKFKTDYNKSLTYSFRCTQSILSKACYFLNQYGGQEKNVFFKSGFVENPNETRTKAVITRSNAGIVELIADAKNTTNRYKLIKDPEAIFAASLSCYHFMNYENDKIHKDYKWIKKFADISDLENFAELTYDLELKKAIELVDKYDNKLFDLFDEAKVMYRTKDFDTYLTNAHISKGLEWDEVTLNNDFPELNALQADLDEARNGKDKAKVEQLEKALQGEVNLYYVALTRAKDKVFDRTDNYKEYAIFCANLRDKQEQSLDDYADMESLRKNKPTIRQK